MMISICWIYANLWRFFLVLLSPLFYVITLFPASLISLKSQFHLFSSGFSLGYAWVPPPSAVAWELCQGSNLGQSSDSLCLFFILQDYCLPLSDVQYLKNFFFTCFFFFFFLFLGHFKQKCISGLFTPSRLEAEVWREEWKLN